MASNVSLHDIDSAVHSIEVTATNLDIRDLTSASDSVAAVQSGTWTIDSITNAVTVTATDLDIRALTNADVVTAEQGTSPWVVSATDLDVRDLTHASDSVKIGDGTDFLAINNDGSINIQGSVSTTPDAYDAWKVTSETVGTSAGQIVSTALANRLSCVFQNRGSKDIYIGPSNAVTFGTGTLVPAKGSVAIDFGASAAIYAISDTAGQNLLVTELAS